MLPRDSVSPWHIVYTMPNAERKINAQLLGKGISTFLPLIKKNRQWSDRKKTIEAPLFPGYLFVKTSEPTQFKLISETKGVVRFLTSNGKLDVISEYELDSIRKLITYGSDPRISRFEIGEDVEIDAGHLRGIKGQLIRRNGVHKLHVLISSIQQCVVVEIPATYVIRSKMQDRELSVPCAS